MRTESAGKGDALFEIVIRRVERSADGTHWHVALVGILSMHTPTEPVLVDVDRALERMVLGEQFYIKTPDGERATVVEGSCHCGYGPTLKTDKDPAGGNLIVELLPEALEQPA